MAAVKMWGRGQLTIPASVRKELHLDEETVLNIVKVGDALLLTQKRLVGDALATTAQKGMKKADLSLEDLLEDLQKQRERYNRERYGG
ncbi:MAG: AbrB family transcriptional regulator [Candidatus Methylomirabilota bacterium]|nr:AbrB/MazE/SpoVT family DNA-binding domain-containing protein [Candidatus Methylomirabilis sp.]NJD68222.1 AbrB/MazE/SpoVT family DNA-binding domain-containing protein [candidate division NC10 bacterium]PWB46177.1 MAG: AbrB family transcriptional regulator [candidate division NC10 bacterium]